MKKDQNTFIQNILYSCEQRKNYATEQVIPEHVLVYVVSGHVEFQFSGEKFIIEPNDILLLRRNQLVKALKIPDGTGEACKTINIFLTQEIIRNYMAQNNISKEEKYKGKGYVQLSKSKFIKAYFESMLPYFEKPNVLSGKMAGIKTAEAIELLLEDKNDLKHFLFYLNEPYKINLEKFVNENFIFNISITELARLTGRSLSTFKRDFKFVFNNSPEKWLKNRRLEEANYLIREKGLKPSEVFYNVGFENYSHFSTAFKERFGKNASAK